MSYNRSISSRGRRVNDVTMRRESGNRIPQGRASGAARTRARGASTRAVAARRTAGQIAFDQRQGQRKIARPRPTPAPPPRRTYSNPFRVIGEGARQKKQFKLFPWQDD